MKRLLFAAGALLAASALAQTPELKQIMADPQWIGPPVEEAWWQLDGEAVYYSVERKDSELIDIHRIDLGRGEAMLDRGVGGHQRQRARVEIQPSALHRGRA